MRTGTANILLIGYGNPGRLDDGLGPALAEAVRAKMLPGVTIETNYQLNVEDAAMVAEHDVVVFADAHAACPDPFSYEKLMPRTEFAFSSHTIEPATLLAIARDVFDSPAQGYALGIRGHEFDEFGESISPQAGRNLDAAVRFIEPLLLVRDAAMFETESVTRRVVKSTSMNGVEECKTESM